MALRAFEMRDIDPKLNFIVGPNGSGKSSVLRAIHTVIEGARSVGLGVPFEDGRLMCSRGAPTEEFQVALEVEFDTDWEKELIATYVCAALTDPDQIRQALTGKEPGVIASNEGAAQYAFWLQELLRPEQVPFLFRGELRFFYRYFVRDRLQFTYTFTIKGTPVTISMGTLFGSYGQLSLSGAPALLTATSPVSEQLLDYWKAIGEYAEIREVMQGKRLEAQVLPGSFDFAAFVMRLAEAHAFVEVRTLPSTYSPYPGPHKRLQELLGRPFDIQQSIVTLAEIFHKLLTQGIVMTSNFRYPPERIYLYAPHETSPVNSGIYDDRQLAQHLFDLKNGNGTARATYRAIQDTFKQITGDGLAFDVISSVNEEGDIALQIDTIEDASEIPIIYHGAGIWEALVLSALLLDNAGKVTLLDEPAANLHPQMQRKFISVVERTQDNAGQIVIVTHSQHLLPTQARDLPKIRRIQRIGSCTATFGLGPHSAVPPDKLEKEMGNSTDLAGLLFASGVILVEGPTETGAIGIWFPRLVTSGGRTLADRNIALFGVNGVQGLPFHIQYLMEFGVPWVVVCDADALDLTTRNGLWRKLVELGALRAVPTTNVFDDLKATAEACGIFTANTALSEKGFEEIPDVKAFIDAHESEMPDKHSKPRRGQYIAHNLPCPEGVACTIQAALEWLQTSAVESVNQYAGGLEPTV